jgi:hypothetical protein
MSGMRQSADHDTTAENETARRSGRPAAAAALPAGWRGSVPTSPAMLSALQGAAGNRAVANLMQPAAPAEELTGELAEGMVADQFVPDPQGLVPDLITPAAAGFTAGGMAGTVPFGDATGALDLGCPHAFLDGGMTGTVTWSGGGGAGARGNQGVGSIQTQIPAVYAASAGPTTGRFSSRITPLTGVLGVTRSWVGAYAGDQGNGWFLTAAAVAKVNGHERNHVASTRGIYAANLAPLEARVANAALGMDAGATGPAAITTHQTAISWVPTITAFQSADTTANQPGGAIDTADVAAGWIVDLGPGTVAGTAFNHRVTNSGEAAPTP